jgi:hypothetical protein
MHKTWSWRSRVALRCYGERDRGVGRSAEEHGEVGGRTLDNWRFF